MIFKVGRYDSSACQKLLELLEKNEGMCACVWK